MYQEWIDEVLVKYDMIGANVKLIRHNENMTFQVDDKYLLRIHKHAEGFTTDPIYDGLERTELYKDELAFISNLKTQGLNVQEPITNKKGELLTMLADGTPATMLSWIPGRITDKSELLPELCYKIGEMVAKLHKASKNFQTIKGLWYDESLCERLKCKIYNMESKGVMDAESTRIIVRALDVIAKEMLETKELAILVHSDLSPSNILITESGLVPIDFSLFGYCHPMMDIAALYCCVNGVDNRSAIAAGYKSLGGIIDFHALDCCFALNILLGIVLHCDSWPNEEWFANRLPGWCSETFAPIGEGKALISSDFYMLNVK